MSSPHFAHAIDVGRQARAAAGKVRRSLFPAWRQRAFRRHLGRFIVALQQVPQSEASTLSADAIHAVIAIVNDVVSEAEAFIDERDAQTTKEVEQDRFVVTEIYQLRAIVESLTRHVTPNPAFMDVRWTVRTAPQESPELKPRPRR